MLFLRNHLKLYFYQLFEFWKNIDSYLLFLNTSCFLICKKRTEKQVRCVKALYGNSFQSKIDECSLVNIHQFIYHYLYIIYLSISFINLYITLENWHIAMFFYYWIKLLKKREITEEFWIRIYFIIHTYTSYYLLIKGEILFNHKCCEY